MKKKIIILSLACLLFTGCGSKTDSWNNATEFGDINLEAEVVDTNDVAGEYEIDKYLDIIELNETKPDSMDKNSFRIYYNRIAEQTEIPYIQPTGYEVEEVGGEIEKHVHEESGTGVYFNINTSTEKISSVYCEIPFQSNTDENFYNSIGRTIAPIFGGLPGLKKYDLNKTFFDLADALEDSKGTYSITYNDVTANVTRDYGYVYIKVSYPK